MATIHFLNVKDGDCSIIEHNVGHKTVIDVCNAKPVGELQEALVAQMAKAERGISGNFQQKKYPVNPISYMRDRSLSSIFRYVQTHPDMDHLDGIEALFREFSPTNFWDTDNIKEMPASSWQGSSYRESDWKFYKNLRDTDPDTDPRRLTLYSGARGQYYNQGSDGTSGGDGLHVLAPTKELVGAANEADEDYNRCSYVILYKTGNNRIVFGGDSHDETWDHILEHHKDGRHQHRPAHRAAPRAKVGTLVQVPRHIDAHAHVLWERPFRALGLWCLGKSWTLHRHQQPG